MENVKLLSLLVIAFIIGLLLQNKILTSNGEKEVFNVSDLNGGEFIHLVYLGSPECSYCNSELDEEIKNLKLELSDFVKNNGYRLFTTGVAITFNSNSGIEFLSGSGNYDEIISGASWLNLGANHYMWSELSQVSEVPQILILQNTIDIIPSSFGISNINREERVLFRFNNVHDVREFSNNIESKMNNYNRKRL
jgi:hypothetical protein